MKAGSAFADLLTQSPPEFTWYFEHCHYLAFQPNYAYLKEIFWRRMEQECWSYNNLVDWADSSSEKGTLILDEYQMGPRFVTGF
jgi:hypothetical protein